jgi:hypothetical protein
MGRISNSPYQLSGWKVRVGLLGLAGMIALIVAGRSLGAVTPHLIVHSTEAGPGQTLSIVASKQKADDPVGRVQVYVPNGFLLNAPATGKSVGKATAKVVVRDVDPNSEATMVGGVSAISLTSTSIAYENTSCDGDQHLAAWMVQLKGAKGSTLSFPIFVDATSGASTSFGPYVLVACFRPADLAANDPNRSAAGSVVDSLSLALSPFFRPTVDGDYRWRSVWTPFAAGTGTLNTAAAVEAQSIVTIPTGQIVIFGKKSTVSVHGKKIERVTITGQILVGGEPVGPGLVTIRHGSTSDKLISLGGAKVGTDGGYTTFATLLGPKEYFQVSSSLVAKDLGVSGCQASFTGVPCIDATSGGGRTISGTMLVKR